MNLNNFSIIKKLIHIFIFIFMLIICFLSNHLSVDKNNHIIPNVEYRNINFYVSNNGDDNNDGSLENPFKTLDKVKNVIKNTLGDSENITTFHVYIMEGTYYFNHTLLLDGFNSHNKIIFKSYKDDNVYFTGGRNLDLENFHSLNNVLIYDLSSYDLNFNADEECILDAPFIISNHNPMTLSRYPDSGYLNIDSVINDNSFICNDLDTDILKNHKNIFMSGYWKYDWSSEVVKLKNIDADNQNIITTDTLQYGLQSNKKFYFFNVPDLDNKDEYYIDYEKNILYLIPSDDISNMSIEIALQREPLVTITNSNNIIFDNIIFEDGRDSAIRIINSNNISITNCIIRNFFNTAISIDSGINNLISNNQIYNLGCDGICVYGGDRNTLSSCYHRITHNSIYNYSILKRTYTPAISANGVGVTISYNTIHDAPDSGIIFSGNDHKIEFNEIYDICTEANDVGAIYCGRDWTARGNVIKNNNIHDIGYTPDRYLVSGIYLDDCFSSANIDNNILTRINLAIHVGGGRDNLITNNKITDCTKSILFDNRGETWANLNEIAENSIGIPYDSPIWLKKYPEIKTLINNLHPGIPFNNKIIDNKIINSGDPEISDSVKKNGIVDLN